MRRRSGHGNMCSRLQCRTARRAHSGRWSKLESRSVLGMHLQGRASGRQGMCPGWLADGRMVSSGNRQQQAGGLSCNTHRVRAVQGASPMVVRATLPEPQPAQPEKGTTPVVYLHGVHIVRQVLISSSWARKAPASQNLTPGATTMCGCSMLCGTFRRSEAATNNSSPGAPAVVWLIRGVSLRPAAVLLCAAAGLQAKVAGERGGDLFEPDHCTGEEAGRRCGHVEIGSCSCSWLDWSEGRGRGRGCCTMQHTIQSIEASTS